MRIICIEARQRNSWQVPRPEETLPEHPNGAAPGGQPWHDLEMIVVVRFNPRLPAGAFDPDGVAAGVQLRGWPREF